MQIEKEKIGIWDVRYFPEYGRIQVHKKLRVPVGSKEWELVEDYHDQKKEDFERIVKGIKEKWGE